MNIINTTKMQIKYITNYFNLFSKAALSNEANKIIENSMQLKNSLVNKIPEIVKIVPNDPTNIDHGFNIMDKYVYVMNEKYNMSYDKNEVRSIFKESYIYLTKTLITANIIGIAGLATYFSIRGWYVIIVPFSIMCTLSVILNANKHKISPKQALENFKKSFKEFLGRDKFTRKEKSIAYIPYVVLSISLFLSKHSWGKVSIYDIYSKISPEEVKGGIKVFRKKVIDTLTKFGDEYGIQKNSNLKKQLSFAESIKLKHISYVITIGTIIYLSLSIFDQMVLRKGKSDIDV